jgi:hypothetical protein
MQGHASGVNGSDAGRRGNDHPLDALSLYPMQECRFAGSRLPREEDVPVRVENVLEREIQLSVGGHAAYSGF